MKFRLERVEFMPKELRSGVLYFAEQYGAAAHLCACGCGSKIRTPIDETEWALSEGPRGPTLNPSIGNWQKPCRSHYFIRNGSVVWCRKWSESEIVAGREFEQRRREEHIHRKRGKEKRRFMDWLLRLFR